jgi:hypothetical protein
MPHDPREIIAYIKIANTDGVYMDSNTYKPAGVTWTANTVVFGSTATVTANRTDDKQKEAEAAQWNQQNKMLPDDPDIPPALEKVVFMRSGNEWLNNIEIDFGGETYTDIEISFRNNAATRGDAQGTIQVFSFTGESFTGTDTMYVTLKRTGQFMMGMRLKDGGGNYYFFEMEWNGVGR